MRLSAVARIPMALVFWFRAVTIVADGKASSNVATIRLEHDHSYWLNKKRVPSLGAAIRKAQALPVQSVRVVSSIKLMTEDVCDILGQLNVAQILVTEFTVPIAMAPGRKAIDVEKAWARCTAPADKTPTSPTREVPQ